MATDWRIEERTAETTVHAIEDALFVRAIRTRTERVLVLLEGGRPFDAHKEVQGIGYVAQRRARQLGIDPEAA